MRIARVAFVAVWVVAAVVSPVMGYDYGWEPGKIQAYGAYMELAQEPVAVEGGFEYVIDFYTDGSTAPDFMVWGFNNNLGLNFHDGLGGWDPDYEHNIYQRWDGSAAGNNWDLGFLGGPENIAWDFASYKPILFGGGWQVPARPYAIDNVWHAPWEYAATVEVLSSAYDVSGGQTYSSAGGGDFVAGQDGLHLVQWNVGLGAGHDPGLLWTLRVVTELDYLGHFDSLSSFGDRPGPGDLTWSLPSLGDRPEGDHGTGGIYPVLGDWTVPPPPPPCDWPGEGVDVGADDIDYLRDNMGGDVACFDLDEDGDVDEDDLTYLVEYLVEWDNGVDTGVGTKRGDFNLDGLVNATDLAILKAGFAQSPIGWAGGNANIDDVVNGTDLAILKTNFGFVAPTSAVPEPATIAVLSLGALALRRRRR
ncbi:hypothetical protein LCGC14_0333460 [marine sediment metagenome]|uniref:Dockerin domain-containing protein n=1 Tax=marine sediment metagenome TaxID=412755 RepID=A0A0F9WN41_9ZZZZ